MFSTEILLMEKDNKNQFSFNYFGKKTIMVKDNYDRRYTVK